MTAIWIICALIALLSILAVYLVFRDLRLSLETMLERSEKPIKSKPQLVVDHENKQ